MPTLNPVKPSFFKQKAGEDGRYFRKETPVGTYSFRFFQDWDGNEKPTGELVFFSPETDDQNLMSGSLQEAEKFARTHLKKKLAEPNAETQKEEKIPSLEEQLLEFAKKFRSARSPEYVKAQYELLLQQAQSMGLISNPLRLKVNRMNKTIGSSLQGDASQKELEVMAQVMELLAKEARTFAKTASPKRVASQWVNNQKRS